MDKKNEMNHRELLAGLILSICVLTFQGCGSEQAPPGLKTSQGISEAVILSTNPAGLGSDLHVNTADNTIAGAIVTGPNPVFLGSRSKLPFVINGDNTVTLYTALSAQYSPSTQSGMIVTAVLPATESGAIAGAALPTGDLYVVNSGSNSVSFLSAKTMAFDQAVPVGTMPVAVAISSAASNAYVVNHGDNSVALIGTADSAFLGTIAVGAQPIWAVASADGTQVFVVDQGDGTVDVISTATNSVITTLSAGASPNFAVFDSVKNALYVTNTGSNSLSVISAAPNTVPVKVADVALSGAPVSVVALPDGSRVYAALGGCPIGTNHTNLLARLASCTGNKISVIDATALREKKVITLGAGVVSVAASSDGSKVYVVNANDGTLSIIDTSTDTELTNGNPARISAPAQNLNCPNTSSCSASGNQTPFAVNVFP